MNIEKEREAFKAWFKKEYLGIDNLANQGDEGAITRRDYAYVGWQAAKAQAVPEGYVVVPMEPTEQILNRMTNAPIEVNHLCDNADIFLSEDEARIAYKAMIEAQEQSHD